MKILYVCADRGIPIRGDKGASIHVRMMVNAFARAGHQVTLFTPRPGPPTGPAPAATMVSVPLPPEDRVAAGERLESVRFERYNDLLLAAVAGRLSEESFDFIYERYSLWSRVGGRLSRLFDLPLVLEVNAPLAEEAARYRGLVEIDLVKEIAREQLGQAAHVAVVSEELRTYVIANGAPPNRVHLLTNGVDPQLFHPGLDGHKIREQHGLQNRHVVGFVGRPRPWHDLKTLLKAVARLRREDTRYHLLLAGRMPESLAADLARYELAGAATLTGVVAHDEIPGLIAAMDVAVSPHAPLDHFYFSPLKLYEYMACGVPAVTARIGQPAQMITHKVNGLLYQPGSSTNLAKSIRYLVEKPNKAKLIGWRGAALVLKHQTWDRHAAAVVRWLDRSETTREPESGPLIDDRLQRPLFQATRPDLVAPFLADSLPLLTENGIELKQVRSVDILKYKPLRRCVIGYDLQVTGREPLPDAVRLVGKVFRDHRGRRLHFIHQLLQKNGFGSSGPDGISVPTSLAYIPELKMQVQTWSPGQTIYDLVDTTALGPYMPLAARGLARLHDLDLERATWPEKTVKLGRYLLGDELENLGRFEQGLLDLRPLDRALISRLARNLGKWSADLPRLNDPKPIHRDFYYSQLLFAKDRLTLIDFDLFALGDPAIDVANFTAHLHILGLEKFGQFNALAEEAARFLNHYVACRPVDPHFMERVAFYQAATFFRLLHVVLRRPAMVHLYDEIARQTAVCVEAA